MENENLISSNHPPPYPLNREENLFVCATGLSSNVISESVANVHTPRHCVTPLSRGEFLIHPENLFNPKNLGSKYSTFTGHHYGASERNKRFHL
jgi:hypothetical protein